MQVVIYLLSILITIGNEFLKIIILNQKKMELFIKK